MTVTQRKPITIKLEELRNVVNHLETKEDFRQALDAADRCLPKFMASHEKFVPTLKAKFIEAAKKEARSNKLFSRKQRLRLGPKLHLCFDEENSVYHLQRVKFKKRNPQLFEYFPIAFASSKKGILYLCPIENGPVFLVRSHFLDRYSLRAFENELTRVKALHSFVVKNFSLKSPLYHFSQHHLVLTLDGGIGLGTAFRLEVEEEGLRNVTPEGEIVSFLNPPKCSERDFLLLNTFISDDMLSESQQKLKAKLLRKA